MYISFFVREMRFLKQRKGEKKTISVLLLRRSHVARDYLLLLGALTQDIDEVNL